MHRYTPPQARQTTAVSAPSNRMGAKTITPWIIPPSYSLSARASSSRNLNPLQSAVPQTPLNAQHWRNMSSNSGTSSPTTAKPASVKHLTCYFWGKYGRCKWNDEECLYAHFHTGKVAQGPVQVEVGRPAVAGNNAQNAHPVYEDWRGGQDVVRSQGKESSPSTIMPDVQHQIDQIVAKAKSVTPTHQVQFLNTYPPGSFVSPTAASFDGQPQHVQALCSAISILSTALDNSRSNAKACKDLMHVECESLLGIARVLHGGRGEVPSYVADLVNSVTILINLVQEQAKLMATLDLIKKEVKADLESVGLEGLLEDEVDE